MKKELIDKNRLIEMLKYSNGWNNIPCPQWAISVIEHTKPVLTIEEDKKDARCK